MSRWWRYLSVAVDGEPGDARVPAALFTAALAGVLTDQLGQPQVWESLFPRAHTSLWGRLAPRAWQTGVHLLLYVVAPLLVARGCGVRIPLGWARSRRYGVLCLQLFALALPVTALAAFAPEPFRATPLFPSAALDVWLLAAWLPLFAAFLFAVEFFYRGFLLSMLTPALGRYALLVMVVPYALTHHQLVEGLGAVGVGLLLGALTWATGSIWLGWSLHAAVAFSAELFGIWRLRRN